MLYMANQVKLKLAYLSHYVTYGYMCMYIYIHTYTYICLIDTLESLHVIRSKLSYLKLVCKKLLGNLKMLALSIIGISCVKEDRKATIIRWSLMKEYLGRDGKKMCMYWYFFPLKTINHLYYIRSAKSYLVFPMCLICLD